MKLISYHITVFENEINLHFVKSLKKYFKWRYFAEIVNEFLVGKGDWPIACRKIQSYRSQKLKFSLKTVKSYWNFLKSRSNKIIFKFPRKFDFKNSWKYEKSLLLTPFHRLFVVFPHFTKLMLYFNEFSC